MSMGMIEVVCAVIECERRGVLACLRPEAKHLAGQWEFPGGKVEEDEGREAALVREIGEELGCRIRVVGTLDSVEWEYPDRTIRLHPFRCRLVDGEPVAHEHQELRWCTTSELAGLDWADADRPIVAQLERAQA